MDPARGGDSPLTQILSEAGESPSSFWRGITDHLDEAVFVVTADRRIAYANERASALMECAGSEAIGRQCLDVMSCPQCQCMCRLFEEGAVKNVEVLTYVPGETAPRVLRKNARLIRNVEGEVIGGIETLSDVTTEVSERTESTRRAQMLLQERKRRDALVDHVCEGVASLDGELRIRDVSERMAELLGRSQGELVGRPISELFDFGAEDPRGAGSLTGQPVPASLSRSGEEDKEVIVTLLPMRYGSDDVLAVVRPASQPSPDRAEAIERRHGFCGFITRSERMQQVFELVARAAETDATILIEGESGTGKELIARAIHRLSPRSKEPLFPVNCATFSGSLLLSELFGHERGAFTGATRLQHGKLELAGHGTLLLDEVGEIPLEHQALMLRVLEDGRFQRLGGDDHIALHARIIAATNRDLVASVRSGDFRDDLYYRLNVVPIALPPLRERPEDVPLLLDYFFLRAAGHVEHGVHSVRQLSEATMDALCAYPWPGNVRELRNLVEYLTVINADEVGPEHLPAYMLAKLNGGGNGRVAEMAPAPTNERGRIVAALEQANYRRAKAAAVLGMDRSTLWRKMRKLGISG